VTRWVYEKNFTQHVAQTFFVKSNTHLLPWKKKPKNVGYICIVKKLPKLAKIALQLFYQDFVESPPKIFQLLFNYFTKILLNRSILPRFCWIAPKIFQLLFNYEGDERESFVIFWQRALRSATDYLVSSVWPAVLDCKTI
jgi:hypothetical protein